VRESLFRSLSRVETPQGAIALVQAPERILETIQGDVGAFILLACGIQDPGNLGTLIRTAAAAGAAFVATTRGTVSARSPKAIRSSAGCFFRLPIVEHIGVSEFRNYCHSHSIPMYRSDATEGTLYTEADLTAACAILLGNEGSGVAEETFGDIPAIRIPLAQGVESLNVAAAGAVLSFEVRRQRCLQSNRALEI
jgi:TrmH family RNA methyltransferase